MSRAIGVVLIVVGGVWFLQGIGVAQGSQMSNNRWWAVIGGAFVAAGVVVLSRALKAARLAIEADRAARSAPDGSGSTVSSAEGLDQRDEGDDRPDAVQRHE